MRGWTSALVVGLSVVTLTPIVAGKVTLDKCASGEAIWWPENLCNTCVMCQPDVAVELGVLYLGDKAGVWLEVADEFTMGDLQALSFRYYHIEHLGLLPTNPSGPQMAIAFEASNGSQYVKYLAYGPVAGVQTACTTISYQTPAWTSWRYGTWDGANLCSFVPVNEQQTVANIPNLNAALVKAVGVILGFPTVQDPTQVVVDNIGVAWGAQCGGVFDLEPPWPNPFGFDSVEQRDAWSRTGLWTYVEKDELFGESAAVRAFPSSPTAAYFGAVNPVTGKGSYKGTGTRVAGYFTSPCNILNPGDKYVEIGFDYYRLVESYKGPYPNQIYDRVWLEYRWLIASEGCVVGEDWQTGDGPLPSNIPSRVGGKVLWYKDSSDLPEGRWTHVDLTTLSVPAGAIGIQIRFGFDSLDVYNNDYLGILIDNVTKTPGPDPVCLEITTPSLPQATVKAPYEAVLTSNKQGLRWQIVVDPRNVYDPLPSRLVLEQQDEGTAIITGHPEIGTQGTYRILVRAVYGDGRSCNTAEKLFTLVVRSPEGPMTSNLIYAQYFEINPNPPAGFKPEWFGGLGWTLDPLWHMTQTVSYKGLDIVTDPDYVRSAYFGQNDETNPNYNNGKRVTGCLTSPWISIPSDYIGEKIILGFMSWREVEDYTKGASDKTWVEVRLEGQPWKQVWYKDSKDPSEKAWTWEELDTCITIPPGLLTFQIRFCFDSVDAYNNSYVGWLVDEVALFAGSPALAITTPCRLPEGAVGLPYSVKLAASGGPAGTKSWFMTNLPPGLPCEPSENEIAGIPPM